METDRAVLAARIRQAHLSALPSFTAGAVDESTTTVVAQALAIENVTLTVGITSGGSRPSLSDGIRPSPEAS